MSDELSIPEADALVPETWDEVCGMVDEEDIRL